MPPSSRVRRKVTAERGQKVRCGYFQSAQLDGAGNFIQWVPSSKVTHETVASTPRMAQYTRDEVHPLAGKKPPQGILDVGGPFLTMKYENLYDPAGVFRSGTYLNKRPIDGKVNRRYVGGFCAPAEFVFQSGADFSSPGSLLVETNSFIPPVGDIGKRAWLRTKPDLQQGDAFVDLMESGELPRMVRTSRDFILKAKGTAKSFRDNYVDMGGDTRFWSKIGPKNVADQFLNVNFGWIPFLKSIFDLSKVIGHYSNLVKKFTEWNGVPIRKRVSLGSDRAEKVLQTIQEPVSGVSYPMPCFPVSWPADFFSRPPMWETIEISETTEWGVGKFTYYRPEFDSSKLDYYSSWNKFRRFTLLTGLRITPTNLYNKCPWTWLLDWVTDIGNFVDHLTDIWVDQIVGHYCYAMRTKRVIRRFMNNLPLHSGSVTLVFDRVIESKLRVRSSSPYDFSLSWDSLSPRQIAILGALGVTRT